MLTMGFFRIKYYIFMQMNCFVILTNTYQYVLYKEPDVNMVVYV